VKDHILRNKGT